MFTILNQIWDYVTFFVGSLKLFPVFWKQPIRQLPSRCTVFSVLWKYWDIYLTFLFPLGLFRGQWNPLSDRMFSFLRPNFYPGLVALFRRKIPQEFTRFILYIRFYSAIKPLACIVKIQTLSKFQMDYTCPPTDVYSFNLSQLLLSYIRESGGWFNIILIDNKSLHQFK